MSLVFNFFLTSVLCHFQLFCSISQQYQHTYWTKNIVIILCRVLSLVMQSRKCVCTVLVMSRAWWPLSSSAHRRFKWLWEWGLKLEIRNEQWIDLKKNKSKNKTDTSIDCILHAMLLPFTREKKKKKKKRSIRNSSISVGRRKWICIRNGLIVHSEYSSLLSAAYVALFTHYIHTCFVIFFVSIPFLFSILFHYFCFFRIAYSQTNYFAHFDPPIVSLRQ